MFQGTIHTSEHTLLGWGEARAIVSLLWASKMQLFENCKNQDAAPEDPWIQSIKLFFKRKKTTFTSELPGLQ